MLDGHRVELTDAHQLQGAPVGEAGHEQPAHFRDRGVKVEAARQRHRSLGQQCRALVGSVVVLELTGP